MSFRLLTEEEVEERKKQFKPKKENIGKKPSLPVRLGVKGPATFFGEAVGGIPQIAEIAAKTSPYLEEIEEEARPSFLSQTAFEEGPEKGLRNLLSLLGQTETVRSLIPQALSERFKESTQGKFEPQSFLERILLRPFQLGGQVAGLGGGLKGALSMVPGGLAGQTLREGGAPEALSTLVELLGPLAQLPQKGLEATEKELPLVNFAKEKGLTEKQITPLLKSERTQEKLGGLALKTRALKKDIKEIGSKFQKNFFEPLVEEAAELPKLTKEEASALNDSLLEAALNMDRSKLPTTDKQAAIEKVLDLGKLIEKQNISPAEIIETWRDINKTVNWKLIGSKPLTTIKKALSEALHKANPEIASDFDLTNKLYSKFKPLERALDPTQLDNILKIGTEGEIAIALALHNPSILKKAFGAVGGKYIAKELLTNPRYHNFSRKFQSAIVRNDKNAIAHLNEQFQKMYQKDIINESKQQ